MSDEIFATDYLRVTPQNADLVAVQVGDPPDETTPTIVDAEALRDALDSHLEGDTEDLLAKMYANAQVADGEHPNDVRPESFLQALRFAFPGELGTIDDYVEGADRDE